MSNERSDGTPPVIVLEFDRGRAELWRKRADVVVLSGTSERSSRGLAVRISAASALVVGSSPTTYRQVEDHLALLLPALPPGDRCKVYIDARRCTLVAAKGLVSVGCKLGHGFRSVDRSAAAVVKALDDSHSSERERLALYKTIGASDTAEEYGLSPAEFQVLRARLDTRSLERVATRLQRSVKTVYNQTNSMRHRASMPFEDLVVAAHETALLAACAVEGMRAGRRFA